MDIYCSRCATALKLTFKDFILTSVNIHSKSTASATIDVECPNCKANIHIDLSGDYWSFNDNE